MSRSAGFTLVEVIAAMTILAMIMTGVYMCMSTAVRLWHRQETRSQDPARRLEAVARMLRNDLNERRGYDFTTEAGHDTFLAAGPRTLFYVTANGLGARRRQEDGVYFTCLFVAPAEDGEGLWLVKTPLPEFRMLEALDDFKALDGNDRATYLPGEALRGQAVPLLERLEGAGFALLAETADGPEETPEQWADDALPPLLALRAIWGGQPQELLVRTAGGLP